MTRQMTVPDRWHDDRWQGKWYTRTKGYFLRSCEVYNNPFESKSGYIKISRRSRSFNMCTGLSGGIFSLKHESSIFRSFIQPCMPVLHGTNSTEPNLFHHGETTCRVGWLIWICYCHALERRCLLVWSGEGDKASWFGRQTSQRKNSV